MIFTVKFLVKIIKYDYMMIASVTIPNKSNNKVKETFFVHSLWPDFQF